MKRISIIFYLVITCGILFSQKFHFEKITTKDGLSQNDANCIFQDHNGFLWVGTNDGLNKYDGYTFKTFRIGKEFNKGIGLSSNLIFKIKEDGQGRLWIGTSNEGVNVFDLATEKTTQIRNTEENPVVLANNRVVDLECMSDGTVWVATDKGVTIISELNGQIETVNLISLAEAPLVSKGCNAIAEDVLGRKWMGFENGLVYCISSPEGIETVSLEAFEKATVSCVLPVGSGVFVGSDEGLFFVDENENGRWDVLQVSSNPTRIAYLDNEDNLYVSHYSKFGVYSCDFTKKKFDYGHTIERGESSSAISGNLITDIYCDDSGIIWIGANGGGLNKYNPGKKKIEHYKSTGFKGSLSGNKVRAVYEDSNQNIWIGTEGGGVDFLRANKHRNFSSGFENYSSKNPFFSNNFYSILELKRQSGADEVWAGATSPQIMATFIGDQNSVSVDSVWNSKIGASVFTMIEDSYGAVWIGTYGTKGLYRYRNVDGQYEMRNFRDRGEPGNISSNIIRSLFQDKNGNIWIGTDDGLSLLPYYKISELEPEFITFKNDPDDERSLSNDYILPIFEAANGDIWIGTMGGGLNKVNYNTDPQNITFTRYDVSDGFPNDVIKGILEDDNNCLWISSNMGLTKFNPLTKEILNFDISDGLQDNEFSELACCKLHDGMMVFGGVNGFNTFYPNEITEDTNAPYVAFTDLQVLNESVVVGQELNNRIVLDEVINETKSIRLKYSENSFAIYFSALHFLAPQKNKYKYMLEGFDEKWIVKSSNERFAKYTSLKPGSYTFKLYASNNDGVWSRLPRELEIVVIPPWWQSTFAVVVYILIIVALLFFFRRFSFIQIEQKNQLVMEHFEKEKIEELNQLKFRFFTNISHEFRTPLTLILGSVQKMISYQDDLPEKIKDKCISIQRNSSVMLRLINQLLDFRKIEQDKLKLSIAQINIVEYLKNIYSSFKEVALQKEIQFNLVVDEDVANVWVDTDKFEKIVNNLLSNAFKFTSQGGKIDLILVNKSDCILVRVKDDGIGISEKVQEHIFERFYQGENGNQSNYGGTGIGLSYSKSLAELHKGNIYVDSKLGEGSCFELELKKGKDHYSDSDFAEEEQVKEDVLNMTHPEMLISDNTLQQPVAVEQIGEHKYSILIVEDNVELLSFLTESFSEYYKVYSAADGAAGLIKVQDHEVDMVISDIAMPLKDGFELCSDIKSDERYSHIPVVLLTAKTTSEHSIKGYELGADAYVSKPFDINVLMAQVAGLLKNKEELKQKFNKSIEINPSDVTTTSSDEKFLGKLLKIVEENISNSEFSVEMMADIFGLPQVNINKKLKALTGNTSISFIRQVRLKRACQLLQTGRYTVADVTYEVGFSDLKYFRSCFKKEFNINPSEYAKQQQG